MHQGLPGSAWSDVGLLFAAVVKLPTNVSIATALQHVLRAQSLSRELGESPLSKIEASGTHTGHAGLGHAGEKQALSLRPFVWASKPPPMLFHRQGGPLPSCFDSPPSTEACCFPGIWAICGQCWLTFNAIYSYYSYLRNRNEKLGSAKNPRARHIVPAGQRTPKPCKPWYGGVGEM